MIIFDLDGVLANCEHRRHLVDPYNYPDICEYSNYRIVCGQPLIDLDGKASWRYKKTGEPFKHGLKEFYEACDKDEPIQPTADLLVSLMLENIIRLGHEIQIWSGRCESVREKTVKWLEESIWGCSYKLKMRPIGNNTPDEILKERWLDEALAEGKKIDMVFDSSETNCDMWNKRGIFVFDCNQSGKEF